MYTHSHPSIWQNVKSDTRSEGKGTIARAQSDGLSCSVPSATQPSFPWLPSGNGLRFTPNIHLGVIQHRNREIFVRLQIVGRENYQSLALNLIIAMVERWCQSSSVLVDAVREHGLRQRGWIGWRAMAIVGGT